MAAGNSSASLIPSGASPDFIKRIISEAALSLGNSTLKPEQLKAVFQFVFGNDVFISLPTGFGKSLCYIILPRDSSYTHP